jgi:hypothetical protein
MLGSIDSTALIHSYPSLRREDLEQLDFVKKRDAFGSWKWINNGMREVNEPQLTFYRTWSRIFRLRVDMNIAKLFRGSNIELPTADEINDGLIFTGNNIKHRTGLRFNAFTAEVRRVHYAFNQIYPDNEVKRVIRYYSDYNLPRMTRTVINDETVYFQNDSRGIRIYDKYAETVKNNPLAELIELAKDMVRFEYFLDESTSVKRFANRMRFGGSLACQMLSESSINAAIAELRKLIGFDNINLSNQSVPSIIFEKTGDINKTIEYSGFLRTLEAFGKDFHLNPKYKISKSTYYRKLKACQELGLCT